MVLVFHVWLDLDKITAMQDDEFENERRLDDDTKIAQRFKV